MGIEDVVGVAGVPVIVGLVEVSKLWLRDSRAWPALALAWGLAINVGVAVFGGSEVARATIVGLVAGLAAAGLYSGARATAGSSD